MKASSAPLGRAKHYAIAAVELGGQQVDLVGEHTLSSFGTLATRHAARNGAGAYPKLLGGNTTAIECAGHLGQRSGSASVGVRTAIYKNHFHAANLRHPQAKSNNNGGRKPLKIKIITLFNAQQRLKKRKY